MNAPELAAPQRAPASALDEVLATRVGGLGLITLNRAKALNALNLGMVRRLTQVLRAWQMDPGVQAVLLRGAGRPAADGKPASVHFCAGGDIRFMHDAALDGDAAIEDFFTEEYALDHLLHTYRKPTVAWLEGVTMGGGMGLAQACALRLGTPSLRMAMPETRIGLFPDVGGGHFLSKLPGALGEYLGVVGPHLGLQDALDIGWVDLGVAPEALDDWLTVRLPTLKADGPGLVADLRRHCEAAAPLRQSEAMLAGQRSAIDRHFSAESLSCIVSSLQADGSEWARQTLSRMAAHSPLMMAVTLAQVRRARGMPLADVFRMERTMVRHCFQLRRGAASETVEGVRALVVDKDHAPRWQPATIDAVQDAAVAAFFEPVWPAWAHPLRDL